MTLSKLHAKIEEEKKRSSPVDGRRFNVRSRVRMDREAAVIKRSIAKERRKKTTRRKSAQGMFSEEEIREGEEAKKAFREEMRIKKELEGRGETAVPTAIVEPSDASKIDLN